MKVFLSSTFIDLENYRKAVAEALHRLETQVGRMEVFGARAEDAIQASLGEVENCDIFVGIYAHRYGYIPKGASVSITEQEFDHAKKLDKPRFCFLIDDNLPWRPDMVDYGSEQSKIREFKKKIRADIVTDTFTTQDDLVSKVTTAVARYITQNVVGRREFYGYDPLTVNYSGHDSILEFIQKAGTFLEEEQYDNAIKIFDTILMLNPKHIEALNGKGLALCKQQKYEEALLCYNEVLKINPRRPDTSMYAEMIKDRIYKERNGHGKISSKETEHDTAVEERTKKRVIKALNDSIQIPAELIKKGDEFYEKGMYEKAILCYDQALKIEPSSELAWNSKGRALDKKGDYEEALSCFKEALRINPALEIYRDNIRIELDKFGRADDSKKYLQPASIKQIDAMPSIFLSFSTADGRDIADHVYRHYKKKGYNVFYSSEEIPYGHKWREVIKKHVEECDIFLLIATYGAIESEEVSKEIKEAKRLEKRIIPCRPNDIKWSDLEKLGIDLAQGPEFRNEYELVRKLEGQLRRELESTPVDALERQNEAEDVRLAEKSIEERVSKAPKESTNSDRNNIEVLYTWQPDPQNQGWYLWEVHLESPSGSEAILSSIDHVEYILPHMFDPQIRIVNKREDGFKLNAIIRGEFEVRILIHFKNGELKAKNLWVEPGPSVFGK